MIRFSYRAIDSNGRIISGQLQAVNSDDLETRLNKFPSRMCEICPYPAILYLIYPHEAEPLELHHVIGFHI